MSVVPESSVEELELKFKNLTQKHTELERGRDKIEAELGARKRALKEAMEQAKKDGFNPDQLPEEIQRCKQIVGLKLSNFEAELDEAEKDLRPMLAEIQKG